MDLKHLTDSALFVRLEALVSQERGDVADIVEHLAEVDRREIAIDAGFSTLFDYCVKTLRYSEAAAFLRIRAARAVGAFPRILDDLRSGAITLDSVMRLSPHLSADNSDKLLDQASGATKREILALVASFDPNGTAPERDVIRPLPPKPPLSVNVSSTTTTASPHDSSAEIIAPPNRVRLSFTADNEFLLMVDQLRSLRRHKFPDGRLEDLLKETVAAMLSKIDPDRSVQRRNHGERSISPIKKRRVPDVIKREVWKRDGGRCTYLAADGKRCESRDFLEYDHILPWALGGRSDRADNIRLLCRPHNQRLGRRRFGPRRLKSLPH
jgi:hypothetical protein